MGILTRTSNQTGGDVDQNGDTNSKPKRYDPVQREVFWGRTGLESKGAPLEDKGL